MNDGVHCLVFSKDRAMQLDAFLRSAKRYAPYETITVLGTITDGSEQQNKSYLLCNAEHSERGKNDFYADWQFTFETFVRDFIFEHERVVFHTDDDVFFRKAWLPPAWWEAVHSLRLGSNTVYCHPLGNAWQSPPEPLETQLLWRWRDGDGDFGYPLSVNGTIYRSQDLLPLLDFPFTNPTELEAGLAARAERFAPEWMTAALHSSVVSLPHNVTSASSGNPRGANPDWQPDALCAKYLDGWRINLDAMNFTNVTSAHQEIPLVLRRG